MARKINTFRPNHPVSPGMFVGRHAEIDSLESALLQTRAGHPKSFMLTGERGIGKTSLLNWIRSVAQGKVSINGEPLNFLVVFVDIDANTTSLALVRKIERALQRVLGETEKARDYLRRAFSYLKNVEALGVRLHDGKSDGDTETLLDEFAYSMASTTTRICDSENVAIFGSTYDGVLILIDEADNASADLNLGSFLKLLLERVQRQDCEHLMVGLAGLPNLRDVLRASHESSLRLFDEVPLYRLSIEESSMVIDRCIEKANEQNADDTTMDTEGRAALIGLSEGFPHFIQQYGYCAFDADSDGVIDSDDVYTGALGDRGAMVLIGDRYYREDFYNKITDSARQVLQIMANRLDSWVTKSEIRDRFTGKDSTLDSAIRVLRERKIIEPREGTRGEYRLQQKGFAWWIKFFGSRPDEIQNQLKLTRADSSEERE